MNLEEFKKRGDDVADAAKHDMPQIAGDTGHLREFQPTGENADVMPPLPDEDDAAAKFIREQEAKQKAAE